MNNKKWLKYTAGILLILVFLAVVGATGLLIGKGKNLSFLKVMHGTERSSFMEKHGGEDKQTMKKNQQQDDGGFQGMQGRPHDRGFDNRGNNRHDGRDFFPPLFGLFRLAVLGLLIWVGYTLFQKSGWRLTRVAASPIATASETVNVEEKKEQA